MAVIRWLLCLLVAAAVAAGATALAQTPRRNPGHAPSTAAPTPPAPTSIAAVVNDEVISIFDLVSRIRIVMISSNLPDTPETRQRISNQVLHQLIDEKLELQEAKKNSVTASDAEIQAAVEIIEKQNNMKPGQLNEFLKSQHIDRGSLVDQLTASIVWGKLVRRKAAETVEISDDEIDEALKRAKEHANEPETRVAEIFLAVDTPAQDAEVRALADRLADQMRKGARFSAVAQQFSKSATAAVGGDLGWVRPNQLLPELGRAATNMKVGELSAPIRTGAGYYLLLVLDRRGAGATGAAGAAAGADQEAVYDIVQVVFALPPPANEAQKRSAILEAEGVRNAAKDCPELLRIGKEKAPQLSSEGHLRLSTISPQMRDLINKLGIGHASQPIVQKNGVGVIMVCGKNSGAAAAASREPAAITRESVVEAISRQRLDTVSRRYLRDLRRNAYVDIRAG